MKRRALLLLLALFLVSPAWAQIAFNAKTDSGDQGTTTPYSWSHTCTGSNRLLVVGVAIHSTGGVSVSGITYNSVALTFIRGDTQVSFFRSELWSLVNPASGSNTVTVTLSGAPSSVSWAVANSLTGVDQASPNDANNGAGGGVTATITTDVTTVADNAWIIDHAASNSTGPATFTVGAGQTERHNASGTGDTWGGSSTEGPVTPAGSTTMSWTISAGKNWVISAASFKPAVAGGIGITGPIVIIGPIVVNE